MKYFEYHKYDASKEVLETRVVNSLYAAYCLEVPADMLPELYSCEIGQNVAWLDPQIRRSYSFWRIR